MILCYCLLLATGCSTEAVNIDEGAVDGWNIDLVYWGWITADGISLCLDYQDSPHMSLEADGGIAHIWRDPSSFQWEIEMVADSGEFPDIECIGDSYPCIIYKDSSTELVMAVKTAGGWESETFSHDGAVLLSPRLAVDQNGNPHLGYLALRSGKYLVCHAVKEGSQWTREEADSIMGGVFSGLDMDLCQEGLPRITVMRSVGGYETVYAYFKEASGEWTQVEIDDDEYLVAYPNIACGTGGRVGITYVNTGSPEGIHLCEYPSPPIVFSAYPDEVYCLAYSPSDTPHISYTSGYYLHHMCRISGSWIETSLGYIANSHDLAVSSDEQPHIAMISSNEVRYMWHTGTTGTQNQEEEGNGPEITISPSPAAEYAELVLGDGFDFPVQVKVFDLYGRTVSAFQAEGPSTEIALDELKSGVYMVRVSDCPDGSVMLTVLK